MIDPFPISVSLQAALLKQISPRRRSFAPSLLSLEVTIKIPSFNHHSSTILLMVKVCSYAVLRIKYVGILVSLHSDTAKLNEVLLRLLK